MPWKETRVFDLRAQFIKLYLTDTMSVAGLSREFGISRTTAYKYIDKYEEYGKQGLHDLPRAPHTHPNATLEDVVDIIVQLRARYPNWGAHKLKTVLERNHPLYNWPAESTIGVILKTKGLVAKRGRRVRAHATPTPELTKPRASCSVWTADYKGQFKLGTGAWCYPLTIVDSYSRMILKCHGLPGTSFDQAMPIWVATFREYGLPEIIRTDNGSPFASMGLGGLSRLSVWWLKLGVIPERIQPGSPQQNGRHEHMHRVLKKEAATPPAKDFKAQQKAFDVFVDEYNYVRPYEAIGMATPAELFVPSARRYPLILPEVEYPSQMIRRHVRTTGCIRWRGQLLFTSEILTGEYVGLDPIDDGIYALYFGPMPLAILDDRLRRWLPGHEASPIINRLREESSDNTRKV